MYFRHNILKKYQEEYFETKKGDDVGQGRKAGRIMRLRKELTIQKAAEEGMNADD